MQFNRSLARLHFVECPPAGQCLMIHTFTQIIMAPASSSVGDTMVPPPHLYSCVTAHLLSWRSNSGEHLVSTIGTEKNITGGLAWRKTC